MNKFLIILVLFFIAIPVFPQGIIKDEFVESWFAGRETAEVVPNLKYNYTSLKRTKIILTPIEKISTPHNVYDGQKIKLKVRRKVRIAGKLIEYGTPASAVVELYTTNGMTGIPATITLGQIKIEGLDSRNFRYYYVKEGQNRTLWILPLKWALTFIPFVGSFTNLIKGGQAKLEPDDDIYVYYYDYDCYQ